MKKTLSFILSVCMCISCLAAVSLSAAAEGTELQTTEEYILDMSGMRTSYSDTAGAGTVMTNINEKVQDTDEEGNPKTDENGEILLEDLLPGIYTVTEKTGGWLAGYLPAERCTVTVEADKTTVLPIVNRRAPKTGDVPSPIPAALLLFGAGAFAVTARRKKRG